ncbi:MAG: hypothetical protein E7646_05225 [Ruminococcaceae bacterium]|nr:hypothetical protein [Oscillospiraceae bacterium]
MNREETVKLLMLIKLAYPFAYKDFDKEAKLLCVELWQRVFKKTPFSLVRLALENFIRASKNPPTLAEICEELDKIHCEARLKCIAYPKAEGYGMYRSIMEKTEGYGGRDGESLRLGGSELALTGVYPEISKEKGEENDKGDFS